MTIEIFSNSKYSTNTNISKQTSSNNAYPNPYCSSFPSDSHHHPVILLWDVKADDLKLLFNFMYEGQVNVAQERLSTFLTLAERLQVRGLTSTTGDGVLNRTAAVAAVKSIVPLVTPTGQFLCYNLTKNIIRNMGFSPKQSSFIF